MTRIRPHIAARENGDNCAQQGIDPKRGCSIFSHASRLVCLLLAALLIAVPTSAQKRYDPGANDTEIKIGNIMPYSGFLSAYALIGRTEAAYFAKINAEGGINGRKCPRT